MIPDTLKGEYYEPAPTLLDNQLTQAFEHRLGPGATPTKGEASDVKGIIVPSYDYKYAAPCAAWSYNDLAASGKPDVIIMISQGEQSATTQETFTTPYGYVRVDQTLLRAFREKYDVPLKPDLFKDEELIRSQLPFLQYTFAAEKETIKILPIIVSGDDELKKLSVDLKETLIDQDKTYAVITPTNLTRYGAVFRYLPFSENPVKQVEALDRKALELIKAENHIEYLEFISDELLNTENYLGIILNALLTKPKSYEVQQYYTTHDIDGDTKRIVSFAAITLR